MSSRDRVVDLSRDLISFYIGRRPGLTRAGCSDPGVGFLIVQGRPTTGRVTRVLHLGQYPDRHGGRGGAERLRHAPQLLPDARRRLLDVGAAIEDDLRSLADAVRTGISNDEAVATLWLARETNARLLELDSALSQAQESLQFNLLGRRQRAVFQLYQQADLGLEHASMQVRLLARALADATAQHAPQEWMAAGALGGPLADLLDLAAETHHAPLERDEAGDLTGSQPVVFDRLANCSMQCDARGRIRGKDCDPWLGLLGESHCPGPRSTLPICPFADHCLQVIPRRQQVDAHGAGRPSV